MTNFENRKKNLRQTLIIYLCRLLQNKNGNNNRIGMRIISENNGLSIVDVSAILPRFQCGIPLRQI
uniref:Uncharacterized protein n=1 Tax=Octopus bimaculoides TaxID=37653 RepID=A0A0L8GAX4_OCTBM